MTSFGYTMMTEQSRPDQLVADVVAAEAAGFVDAGFTEVALVQIGGEHQQPFMHWAQDELLPALRTL